MLPRLGICSFCCLVVFMAMCRAAASQELTLRSAETIIAATPIAKTADWPWWRGPNGDGLSRDADVPTHWSTKENVRWKTPVPGHGFSSPIICDEQIYLTT